MPSSRLSDNLLCRRVAANRLTQVSEAFHDDKNQYIYDMLMLAKKKVQKEYEFMSQVVTSMPTDGSVNSVAAIDYLSRYSNNLIAVSPLQTIDIEPTEESKNSLFRNYIYENA